MRECNGAPVDFHRIDVRLWESPYKCLAEPATAGDSRGQGGTSMNELTIRGAKAQQNLLEWSQRVADCRSSGVSVSRWCAEHDIKPKTYYNWQKKVFAAMIEQQKTQLEQPQERRFAELPAPEGRSDLVATVHIGSASLEVYSGANADVVAALCKAMNDVK